ncbi:MAG: ribosomal RNA small subunit methyltransferase A [Candidatus Wildermuthbacteria bacterium]|nr:ribosomal RNA small subunit methyltransferase A [Candidatus Wildermuthbacteria bacterium]
MNLTSLRLVKEILLKHGIRPSKGFGQNFLINRGTVKKLVATSAIQSNDTILEIGPGIGTLTQELALAARKVIAVEKDKKMVEILRETLSGFKNIEIIHGDALKANIQDSRLKTQGNPKFQIPKAYKVVANLPYYITAPAIRKFLESDQQPESLTLIVQKEVAQRICAKPPKMSILAASVQVYATPEIISYIKKTAFWPKPKVDAAILKITPFPQPYSIDFPKFFTVVKAGFKQPRKQLVNNLSKELALPRAKAEQWLLQNTVQPARRAETLSIQDWINLTNTL